MKERTAPRRQPRPACYPRGQLGEPCEKIIVDFSIACSVRELSDSTDNLIQPFDDLVEYFRHSAGQSGADSFNRERAYLTDLYPRFLWQPSDLKLQGQWEAGGLRLAGKSDGNDGAGAFVEYIVTKN